MQSIPGVRSKGLFCSLGLAVCVLFVASSALAQPQPPELTRPVNDFAGVIDADSARQMESLIRSLQETTGDVVVVATIDSLEGEDIYQYAVKMFENHGKGIGQKGKDNGLLVLVAITDRSVKIEVGYDLEQFITDGFAGETIREEMAPRFRRGDYGAGTRRRGDAHHRAHRRRPQRRDFGRAAHTHVTEIGSGPAGGTSSASLSSSSS